MVILFYFGGPIFIIKRTGPTYLTGKLGYIYYWKSRLRKIQSLTCATPAGLYAIIKWPTLVMLEGGRPAKQQKADVLNVKGRLA